MLTVAGTLIGFGAFGYSVVKLTQKDWRSAAITGVGGIAVLSLVGWNLRKMTGFNAPTRNFMKRSEVEKILDASQGKIVGVTFVKKDGSERTLVGRIQKRYHQQAQTHWVARQPAEPEDSLLSMICRKAHSIW